MRWSPIRRRLRQTIDEAERLLSGRLLDSRDVWRSELPAWRIVATLGHASRAELRRLEASLGRRDPDSWRGAVAFLAGETLSVAPDEEGLIRVQRRVLIPLELSLLGGEGPPPTNPLAIIDIVRRALNTPRFPDS
jgi:hypothetical protein